MGQVFSYFRVHNRKTRTPGNPSKLWLTITFSKENPTVLTRLMNQPGTRFFYNSVCWNRDQFTLNYRRKGPGNGDQVKTETSVYIMFPSTRSKSRQLLTYTLPVSHFNIATEKLLGIGYVTVVNAGCRASPHVLGASEI